MGRKTREILEIAKYKVFANKTFTCLQRIWCITNEKTVSYVRRISYFCIRIQAFFLEESNFVTSVSYLFTVSILNLVTCAPWLYAFKMLFSASSTQQSTNLSSMFRGLQIKNLKYLRFEAEVSYKHVFHMWLNLGW